jgi:hypothetical protein
MHPLSKFRGLKAEGGALDAVNFAPTAVCGPGDGGKKGKKKCGTKAGKNIPGLGAGYRKPVKWKG